MSLITKTLITKSLITKTLISSLIGIDDSAPSAPRFIAGWTGEQGCIPPSAPSFIDGWTGVLNCGVVTNNGVPVTHNGEVVTNGTV